MFPQIQIGNASDTIGRNGQVISPSHMNDERNYPITIGRALQVYDLVVDATPDSTDTYILSALGESVTLTIDDETQTEAVDALVALWNANPILRSVFTATNVSNTTVRLTANSYGTDITVTHTGTGAADNTFSEATAPANATQIGIGVAMYFDGSGGVRPTNPNSGNLDALAGFTRLIEEAEQTGVAAGGTDLYEDNEDVCVMKRCRMIVDTGDTAVEGQNIWIETTGKAYNASGATAKTLTLTPDGAPSTGDLFSLSLNIDGTPVHVEFVTGATETVQAAVEGIQAALAAATATTLLTATEDNSVVLITLADPDASLQFTASDNLAGVIAVTGSTRLELPLSKGMWAGPNKIELKGGF